MSFVFVVFSPLMVVLSILPSQQCLLFLHFFLGWGFGNLFSGFKLAIHLNLFMNTLGCNLHIFSSFFIFSISLFLSV